MAGRRRRGRAPRHHGEGHGRRDRGPRPRRAALSAPRRASFLAGASLAALGVLALVEATRLKDDWQGARLMPAAVGLALLALGVAHVVTASGDRAPAAWPTAVEFRRVVVTLAITTLYVLGQMPLGFVPATVLFVLVLVRFMGGFSWPKAIALSMAVALGSHLVFRYWLGMPLPSGVLGI